MNHKKGFLLIELLIALTIFLLFFSSISKLQLQSLALRDLAKKRSCMLNKVLSSLDKPDRQDKNDGFVMKIREYNNYANLKNFRLKKIMVSSKAVTGKTCNLEIILGEELC